VNPEPFLQLDRVIHEKGRLAIMSMLAASPELSFTELRDALEMTDGNIMTHIRTLQEAGYISVSKSYENNRPHTTCSLTAGGKKAYANYVNLLEQIVSRTSLVKNLSEHLNTMNEQSLRLYYKVKTVSRHGNEGSRNPSPQPSPIRWEREIILRLSAIRGGTSAGS
jgi:DNA-binding MarR family transcriptional regulator